MNATKRPSILYLCRKPRFSMSLFRFLLSKVFVKQLAMAALLVVLLVFGILWWLRQTTNHNEHIAVPDLQGMSLTLVEQELKNAKLRYTIIDSTNYNPENLG